MRFPSWSFETTKYIYISLLWISLSIPVFLHIDQKHRLQVNITPQGPHLPSGWLPANLQEAMNNGFPYPETITASGRPRKSLVDMKHTPTCHVSYYGASSFKPSPGWLPSRNLTKIPKMMVFELYILSNMVIFGISVQFQDDYVMSVSF